MIHNFYVGWMVPLEDIDATIISYLIGQKLRARDVSVTVQLSQSFMPPLFPRYTCSFSSSTCKYECNRCHIHMAGNISSFFLHIIKISNYLQNTFTPTQTDKENLIYYFKKNAMKFFTLFIFVIYFL